MTEKDRLILLLAQKPEQEIREHLNTMPTADIKKLANILFKQLEQLKENQDDRGKTKGDILPELPAAGNAVRQRDHL